ECHLPHSRRTGRKHGVEQSPPLERDDAGPRDLVGGDGVAGERGPIDEHYIVARAGQQEGGRGAGSPGPDDHNIVRGHGFLWVVGAGIQEKSQDSRAEASQKTGRPARAVRATRVLAATANPTAAATSMGTPPRSPDPTTSARRLDAARAAKA